MAAPLLHDYVRDYLIAQNLVRHNRVAAPIGDPDRPPVWIDPRDGTPAPGELTGANRGTDSVVGIVTAAAVPVPQMYGQEIRIDGLDFILRTTNPVRARQLEARLQELLNDRRGWDCAGLWISESLMVRGLSPIVFDKQAFTFVTGYTFERRQVEPPVP